MWFGKTEWDGPEECSCPPTHKPSIEEENLPIISKDMADSLWGTKEVSPQVNIPSMKEELLSVAKRARIEVIGKIKMIEELQKEAALLMEVAGKAEDMALMDIIDSM
jgi:hypothetical protein